MGAAVELVPDRVPDPVGHAARAERRRRRGRRLRDGSGVRRPGRGVERGSQVGEEGVLPFFDGAELPRAAGGTQPRGDGPLGGLRARRDRGRGREAARRLAAHRARGNRRAEARWSAGSRRARRSATRAASNSTSSSARWQPRSLPPSSLPERDRFRCSSSTIACPTGRTPTSRTHSRPRSRCAASCRSCRGRTCGGRRRRSGTSGWRISTTPTGPSTQRATAFRPTGSSSKVPAVCSAPSGFRGRRSRRPRRWMWRGSSFRWRRSGDSPTFRPLRRRRSARWSSATGPGSRPSGPLRHRCPARGTRRPRSCCDWPRSRRGGSSRGSRRCPGTRTLSTRFA